MKSQYKEIRSGRINVKSMTKIQKGTKRMSMKAFRNVFARQKVTRFTDYRQEKIDLNLETWNLKGSFFSSSSGPSSSPIIAIAVKIFSRFQNVFFSPVWRLSWGLPVVWLTPELEPGFLSVWPDLSPLTKWSNQSRPRPRPPRPRPRSSSSSSCARPPRPPQTPSPLAQSRPSKDMNSKQTPPKEKSKWKQSLHLFHLPAQLLDIAISNPGQTLSLEGFSCHLFVAKKPCWWWFSRSKWALLGQKWFLPGQ